MRRRRRRKDAAPSEPKPAPAKKPEPAPAPAKPEPAAPAEAPPSAPSARRTTVAAAPAVRRLARERGIDLHDVQGSGPGGRVTREDLDRHAERAASPRPAPAAAGSTGAAAPSSAVPLQATAPREPATELPPGEEAEDKYGSVVHVPLNQIRKTIANQMAKSASTIPHVTHHDEADVTELERLRRRLNDETGGDPKLTAMSLVIRAVCIALRKYPVMNASFDADAERITYKRYYNIGIAVDSQRGLIVPVIRDADRLTLAGIAGALRSIADRIRSNQFAIEDLRGGTFTITNYGALGGIFGTPIINHPEVAILGLGRMRETPVVRGEELEVAQLLPLSLSFDHRATDGATAARFTNEIMSYLQTPEKFLLHA